MPGQSVTLTATANIQYLYNPIQTFWILTDQQLETAHCTMPQTGHYNVVFIQNHQLGYVISSVRAKEQQKFTGNIDFMICMLHDFKGVADI